TGHRTAFAFNGSATEAPLLHIEYSTVPPPEEPPVADLILTQTGPLTVRADASGSTDTDLTPIVSFDFNWGDGSPHTITPTALATHQYVASGLHTVTVVASDGVPSASSPVSAQIDVTSGSSGSIDLRVASSSDDAEEPA